MSKFQIPKNRKEKLKLLKDLQAGNITLDDLLESNYDVALWFPNYDKNGQIIQDAYFEKMEAYRAENQIKFHVTLNIS